MKVTEGQQRKIRDWGLIRRAQERAIRCGLAGDLIGVAYNERMIAKYKKMLEERPVPEPPPIPRAIP